MLYNNLKKDLAINSLPVWKVISLSSNHFAARSNSIFINRPILDCKGIEIVSAIDELESIKPTNFSASDS